MRSKSLFIFISLITSTQLLAQDFNVGHMTMQFYDNDRNREVTTEIYYPSDLMGDNVSIASGNFPVLSFGHGFLMEWESYQTYWQQLVPLGYVLCFPTTEMSFSPSHQDFGIDLKFIIESMQRENDDSTSLFFNSISDKSAVMGHSMGGGASCLAAQNTQTITTLINFAAAETSPSALSAAVEISIPTLVFSGDDDCVTPAATNQVPLYDNLASNCKALISIINGGHCYFADDNFTCSLGETFCNPALDITREEQLSITLDYLKLWLDYTLYDNENALQQFKDSLDSSTSINYSETCNTTAIEAIHADIEIEIFPNPIADKLNLIITEENLGAQLLIYNLVGELIHRDQIYDKKNAINISNIPTGTYYLIISKGTNRYYKLFVKVD